MRTRSLLGPALALALCPPSARAAVPAAARPAAAPEAVTVTLLHVNDVYQMGAVDHGQAGGLARLATLRKQVAAETPRSLFLIAGDFLSPSVASRLFKGAQMIDAFNAAGLDVATLGNHEFDLGPEVLAERVAQSRFAYVVANLKDRRTGRAFVGESTLLRELGGVRVGVVGLILSNPDELSSTGPNAVVEDPLAVGIAQARRLRAQGADVVVALTHLSMVTDKRLAALADFDVILGGHDHEVMYALAGRTPIFKMGAEGRLLGRVDLHLARVAGRYRLQSMDWQAIPVDASVPDDPQAAAVVARYEEELDRKLGDVVGATSVPLEVRTRVVRAAETNLGDFVADAYREALGADVALVNSGSLRSDTLLPPGPLRRRDVLGVLQFENPLAKVRLSGRKLREVLEHGVSLAPQPDGRFPQVSGLRFRYDPRRPEGQRVGEVLVGGRPLEADGSYTVALSAFLLRGGDAYDFSGAEILVKPEVGPVEPDVVLEALHRLGTIAPATDGRITAEGDLVPAS